jgi:hypothetical protein
MQVPAAWAWWPEFFFFFSECYITDANTNRRPRPTERRDGVTRGLYTGWTTTAFGATRRRTPRVELKGAEQPLSPPILACKPSPLCVPITPASACEELQS